MPWYDKPENFKPVLEEVQEEPSKEEIFEALTLSAKQAKDFAKKFGLDVTQDQDGTSLAIPSDHFKDSNFTSQFLDYWIGNTNEKLALEQKRKIRNSSYKLMDEILGMATLALDMYADEGLGVGFIEQPIDIEFSDEEIGKKVKEILKRNEFIKHSRSNLRNLTKWGDFGVLIELPEGSDPLDIKLKVHTPEHWTAFSPANCKVAVGYSLQTETYASDTKNRVRKSSRNEIVLQPWEFVQFSVFDSEFSPYGRGLLEGMRTAFDQLVTIEALLAMSRATRVERLIIKIPTGQTNPTAALAKLNDLKSRYKNSMFSDKGTGRKTYAKNPAMQDIMFVPADEGFDISRLASGSGVEISNTDDVEYFRNNLIMVTGIPKGILMADESTDRYHALAQQDLKFSRKLIPFQDAYAAGLTKLCMLLVGYVGGDIENTEVTVKIKRPVQVSDTILSSYEAISRAAIEMIDNFKRSQETNEGDQPRVKSDLYAKLLAQLGMPEVIVTLLNSSMVDDPDFPDNSQDDHGTAISTSDSANALFNEIAARINSKDIYFSNRNSFSFFKENGNNKLLEVLEAKPEHRKALNILTEKDKPKK